MTRYIVRMKLTGRYDSGFVWDRFVDASDEHEARNLVLSVVMESIRKKLTETTEIWKCEDD